MVFVAKLTGWLQVRVVDMVPGLLQLREVDQPRVSRVAIVPVRRTRE